MTKTTKPEEALTPAKGVAEVVLLVMHVAVLIGTVLLHPPFHNHADGALPTDLS